MAKGVIDQRASVDFQAGILHEHVSEWKKINASSQVLTYVSGVFFSSDVPPSTFTPANTVLSIQEDKWITEELLRLEDMQAIERCKRQDIHLISPLKVVPKKNPGEFRLVVNMRRLNSYMSDYSSKLENVNHLMKAVSQHCYFLKIDLRHGYFHVPISIQCQKFMGIHFKGQYYRYKALPFGASFAPYVFNKVTKTVSNYLRQCGIMTLVYLDDFVFIFRSQEDAKLGLQVILETFRKLGLCIHKEKSMLIPSQSVEFLGFHFSSVDMMIRIPPHKVLVLQDQLRRVISKLSISQWLVARDAASIAGKILAYMKAFSPAKLMMRPLFRLLNEISATGNCYVWNRYVFIDQEVIQRLHWVLKNISNWNGVSLINRA